VTGFHLVLGGLQTEDSGGSLSDGDHPDKAELHMTPDVRSHVRQGLDG